MPDSILNLKEIKRRREAVGMTLQEAADRAGWGTNGRQRWFQLEAGRPVDPQISTVVAVARALNCQIEDLLLDVNRASTGSRSR